MAKQNINIGVSPNDGTGDPVRTAFSKAKGNFDELYARATGDMNKSTYDADNSGAVDAADKVTGVDAAGNVTYYGKDAAGVIGFHTFALDKVDAYADFASFPIAGFDDVIYIDKAAFVLYLWDDVNTIYKAVAGGVSQGYVDAKVEDLITDGVLDKAPSQNAVFDALALKANIANLGDNSYYDYSFKVDKKNRAWQGVGVDATGIYVCSDRDENFALSNTIQKYDHKGKLLAEKLNAYTLTSPTGKFMSFGSSISIDGFLFIAVYDFNGGGAAPYISRVAKFNATTLAYIEHFEIGNGVAESIWKYAGEYYICYFDIMKIRKFNASWVQQAEYNLSQTKLPDGGYQAIFEEGGFWYMNWHGSNDYTGSYAPGLDKYSFDGTTFTYIETLDAPTFGAGQGVVPYDGKYYWIDRPGDSIVVTTKLDVILPLDFEENTVVIPTSYTELEVTNLTNLKTLVPDQTWTIENKLAGKQLNMNFHSTGGVSDVNFTILANNVNKFLFGYDYSPNGFRIYNYGVTKSIFFNPFGTDKIGLNGITDPKAKLDVDGGVKIANDADVASAAKAGTFRYRVSGTTSYCEMCMQTGVSTYAWIVVSSNTW